MPWLTSCSVQRCGKSARYADKPCASTSGVYDAATLRLANASYMSRSGLTSIEPLSRSPATRSVRYAEAGRTETSLAIFADLSLYAAWNVIFAGPSSGFARMRKTTTPSRISPSLSCGLASPTHFETRRDIDRHRNGNLLALETGEIVGDADAHIELIARRNQIRHVRRQDEIAAHRRRVLRDADLVGFHRDGHQAQLAVEIVRHVVGEFFFAAHIDDARPERHRFLMFFLERIEMAREQIVGVAARRGHAGEFREFRQDQIENLARVHFEHALAEEVIERIAEFVARDLQDSFVDREHDGARRLRGGELDLQRFARLDHARRGNRQTFAARVAVHRKRDHAVAQRRHEDFVR